MDWKIDAPGLSEVLQRVAREYPAVPLYVTENGAAFHDEVGVDGAVNDEDRRAYFDAHLRACYEAIKAGTPLKGYFDPEPAVVDEVAALVARLRAEVEAFAPEVIYLFWPDHLNGFFLDVMPQFCIGMAAESVGDYQTAAGPLNVPRALAEACANAVVEADIDLGFSYRMQVDHGCAQPLEELTGALDRYPVVPIFINSVAPPVNLSAQLHRG